MGPLAVIALGSEIRDHLRPACEVVAQLAAQGYQLLLTHGSGGQVGNILLQNVQSRSLLPLTPLDVVGAQSQGQTGYLIQNALESALVRARAPRPVACVLTRVLVDPADPAFQEPSKAVGPIYTPTKAMELIRRGLVMHAGSNGWRQVVPAPEPQGVLELGIIRTLLEQGAVVVAAGGGGVPVIRDKLGAISGVEAVVEKELTAARLAADLKADLLVLAAESPRLTLGERTLDRLTPGEARRLVAEDLLDGPLGLRLTAARRFVEATGAQALITRTEQIAEALEGRTGTLISGG